MARTRDPPYQPSYLVDAIAFTPPYEDEPLKHPS